MSTKVVTGKVRFSFVNVWEPRPSDDGGDPRYSVTLLIPKTDRATVEKLRAAMDEAAANFRAKNGAQSLPAKPNTTLHDGDGVRASGEPFGPECRGCYVMTVNSKAQPAVVDAARNPIIDQQELYSGCYGRASINVYAYSRSGKKGISAGLLALQKLADGEPFGTVGSADDFADGYSDNAGDDDWM